MKLSITLAVLISLVVVGCDQPINRTEPSLAREDSGRIVYGPNNIVLHNCALNYNEFLYEDAWIENTGTEPVMVRAVYQAAYGETTLGWVTLNPNHTWNIPSITRRHVLYFYSNTPDRAILGFLSIGCPWT